MKKILTSAIYLIGFWCNIALMLIGVRIIQAGYFSGRAGHIAMGSEALFFGIMFVVFGLGGAIYLLIAGILYLRRKSKREDAD